MQAVVGTGGQKAVADILALADGDDRAMRRAIGRRKGAAERLLRAGEGDNLILARARQRSGDIRARGGAARQQKERRQSQPERPSGTGSNTGSGCPPARTSAPGSESGR